MKEYLTIGSTPYDEPCAQVGQENYHKQMRIETRAFKNQMQRIHPIPQENTSGFENCSFLPYYSVKSFPHDFGSYHEVCAIYDDNCEASCKWAFEAEEKCRQKGF